MQGGPGGVQEQGGGAVERVQHPHLGHGVRLEQQGRYYLYYHYHTLTLLLIKTFQIFISEYFPKMSLHMKKVPKVKLRNN